MYSGSRGILYTTPPEPTEQTDDADEDVAATATDDAPGTAAESEDELAADD